MDSIHWKIAIIGLGRLGSQLAVRIGACGLQLVEILNRSAQKGTEIAKKTDARLISRIEDLSKNLDLYILAVPDDQIVQVARSLGKLLPKNALVVHTSGATPGSVLAPYFSNFGVFYPLQTFSAQTKADFTKIPILFDAVDAGSLTGLEKIAKLIGGESFHLGDEERKSLHVAAVFANNFTNHLVEIAYQILENHNIPFQLIRPLLEETVKKALANRPASVQTGPAIRNDIKTIQSHLDFLANENDHWREIYCLLTKSIQQTPHHS